MTVHDPAAEIRINPAVLSGTPCLAGTRIPVYIVTDFVFHHGVDEACTMWDLSRAQVLVACWYAGAYGTLTLWDIRCDDDQRAPGTYRDDPVDEEWLTRWRTWAFEVSSPLWHGHADEVTDPPRAGADR